MKTINKILLMMSSIFALTIMCAITVNVNAQCSSCFTAAATTDNSYGSSVSNVENTGNDINTFSGTTYKVTVWDKNNSGTYSGKLGWHVGASTGTISLGNGSTITDAHDPDVCLVQVSSTVYALTVYHSASQSMYYFQVFSWNSSAFVSSSGPTALQTTTTNFGTAINIDIDDNNVFVIVWDTPAPTVFCRTGTGITLANCPIQIKSSAKMPDIAMYWNGTNVETALITYVITSGPNGGKIEVNYQDYINQLSGCSAGSAGNPSLYTSPSPTYAFTYPRIAAANTSGFKNQWSVEVEDHATSSPSQWLIVGFTNASNNTHAPYYDVAKHTYDDYNIVTDSPGDISNVPNLKPAVTYDNTANYFFVGWTFDNHGDPQSYVSSSSAYDAIYPIVLWCDVKGERVSTTNYNYWEEPYGVATNDDKKVLSVAGRYVASNLYSHYDNAHTLTYDKVVSQTLGSLRQASQTNYGEGEIIFYPNPFTSTLKVVIPNGIGNMTNLRLKVYDMTGKEITSISGNGKDLDKKISSASIALEKGVYIFKITSENTGGQWLQKLIKL